MAAGVLLVLALLAVGAIAALRGKSASNAASPTATPPVTTRNLGPKVAMGGTLLAQLAHVQQQQPLPGTTPMEAEVAFRVPNRSELDAFVKDVYDPTSARYEDFLTPKQFASRFAPAASSRRSVSNWLRSEGLTVTDQPRNGLLVVAHGTAAQMNHAFGTTIYNYSDRSGFTFYANSTKLHVPQSLRNSILDVDGLNNIGHISSSVRSQAGLLSRPLAPHPGFTPQDLQRAYGMASMSADGLDGGNQTIALAEWGDFAQSDLDTYDQEYGISAPAPERISVPFNGQEAHPGPGQEEVELDIEVIHAIAPKAHVLVYVSPQTNGAGLAQANRMVSDNRANLISVSWGFPDVIASTAVLAAIDQVLAEAAAQGQAILVASGDNGAFDAPSAPSTPIVDYPSSSPWVTAVGGTSLFLSGSSYGHEDVWGNSSRGSGSGGGLSYYFKRPWYQSGAGVSNSHSSGARQTPDVAAVADPATGYSVYVTLKGDTGWGQFGGTSASTPLWAGYIALVQQKLGHNVGFLNPLLYRLGQRQAQFSAPPYHDVTQGDNLYYKATAGWDFGTGWGSMDGAAMLNAIQQLESK